MNGWKPEASKDQREREGVEVNEDEKDRQAWEEWERQRDVDPELIDQYVEKMSFQADMNALQGEMDGALVGESGPVTYRGLLRDKELWEFAALKLKREIEKEEVDRLISLYRLMTERYHAEARPPEDPDRHEDFLPSGASRSELD